MTRDYRRPQEECGIGLSLTKGLVELMKGCIKVVSRPGKGSIFSVELPVIQSAQPKSVQVLEGLPLSKKVDIEFSDVMKNSF